MNALQSMDNQVFLNVGHLKQLLLKHNLLLVNSTLKELFIVIYRDSKLVSISHHTGFDYRALIKGLENENESSFFLNNGALHLALITK